MVSLINFKMVAEEQPAPQAERRAWTGVELAVGELQPQPQPQLRPQQSGPSSHFVVSWRGLRFAIEPKWHERLASKAARLAASARSRPPKAAAEPSAPAGPKLVLDGLDGCFRSGQLTAILGPSGAGKTTLLDCLTGHRKEGLSGSIGIDSSALSADNLKVSIIPQNDHLMGHLSVYETLSYASKMKNCLQPNFNHKLNIKRVAQQLGLSSCLATRINKLSGGQYKRVSIAQELLSSPDILILDEPTSGLDAMTCFQTVQVLRKLTDERARVGQNQLAVILTIHQPNRDVFQLFDHVYVVAQGGKCIFEGPPARIEPLVSQAGLSPPSGYYNPATMIVEIAAGKFGQEPVDKLNSYQRKQHSQPSKHGWQASSPKQQPADANSLLGADSAVECCPSSSAWSSSSTGSASSTASGAGSQCSSSMSSASASSSDNDIDDCLAERRPAAAGLGRLRAVNKAFVLEVDKGLAAKSESPLDDCDGRRKKRRRARKRSEPTSCSGQPTRARQLAGFGAGSETNAPVAATAADPPPPPPPPPPPSATTNPQPQKRLKLNSLKAGQQFPFWRHTYLHFHRCWLSIVRDPMLCSMQLALHVVVPLMVSLVYGTQVGRPNACPRAGPTDIMAYALEPHDSALQLQEELRTTLENIGYIFFKLYGIIFAAMTVTVLTFPLDMHVLVKEFRNGWYNLSSYFIGRTLADVPFQLTLPLLAMSLSYYATGQPYSYMQWRFLSITAILILSSLIAQSQGLLFGAILMDKMKAAVFVAPAATTPIILFAGFLVRTQSIPRYLRPLSSLSYLRYAIEACLISRYGFNQCECDPAVFNQTVPELPPIARSMLDYWLSSFRSQQAAASSAASDGLETTLAPAEEPGRPDLFTKLIDSLARANSFGRNITTCEQVVPYPMIDYDLKDSQLADCFAILLFMLVATRLLTFFIVCFKVKRKV